MMVKSTSSTEFDARTTTEVVPVGPSVIARHFARRRIHAHPRRAAGLVNVAAGTPRFVSRGVTDSAPPMFTTADGAGCSHTGASAHIRVLADPPPVAVVRRVIPPPDAERRHRRQQPDLARQPRLPASPAP